MPHGTTVNQLPNNDGMVDSVKRLAKVKEAGSQIATRIIKLREPVVDEIEQTVSGGRSFKTTKLATICSPTSSIIQETTKSSKTLDKIGVELNTVNLYK